MKEGLFQFPALRRVAEVADHLGEVFQFRRRLGAVAEGHDAEGHLVVQLVLGHRVEDGPHHVEALIDVRLHGNGGVDDHRDAGARHVVLGVVLLVARIAGVNRGHLKELGPLKRRVHLQNRHEVEAVARYGALCVVGFHGDDGQIGGSVALLRGFGPGAELRQRSRQVLSLADIHDRLVILEEQHGLTLRPVGEEQGKGLIPRRGVFGLHPAVGFGGGGADLQPVAVAGVDVEHGEGTHRLLDDGGVLSLSGPQACAGVGDDALVQGLFAFHQQRRTLRRPRRRRPAREEREHRQYGYKKLFHRFSCWGLRRQGAGRTGGLPPLAPVLWASGVPFSNSVIE